MRSTRQGRRTTAMNVASPASSQVKYANDRASVPGGGAAVRFTPIVTSPFCNVSRNRVTTASRKPRSDNDTEG